MTSANCIVLLWIITFYIPGPFFSTFLRFQLILAQLEIGLEKMLQIRLMDNISLPLVSYFNETCATLIQLRRGYRLVL